ncbi:hypothetical protein GHT06_013887 [Daphnia sinensis]|uniref:Uncharacterized protein n=1 Tax=Daphnia sinensis TaxID=1820382 RepID=A0AAD5LDF0_9CRUS|nr:hypothetical protein GHT06_013887 [Daphnia sinensis]
MKTFVVLSALVLAVCVVTSQGKPTGNTNINQNSNENSNFDILSSFLSSWIQQRKAKAATKAVASRAGTESPVAVTTAKPVVADVQEDNQQAVVEIETPADDSVVEVASIDESAPRAEPQQEEPQQDELQQEEVQEEEAQQDEPQPEDMASQFKFIQTMMTKDF